MSFLGRLLGTQPDPKDALRPLWHTAIGIAREPHWYAIGGVADTVPGRFDAVAMVTALIMLRMDGNEALKAPSARLTELFVEDMDGQMRQSGVGDLMVGKRMGKLMQALGGRIAAFREALAQHGDEALVAAVSRNVTLADASDPAHIAAGLRRLAADLAVTGDDDLLAGRIAR
ncbi:cytochrome b pre-mRNA-processing protein 3 [Novosphingobium kunmingense]|uniref:Cytochrome b pre-mRNA-processing protein 3 n=1 Tax=Novosphingobium kunmingense TaxID=1211806 RepID=A0A2N0H6J5_9SPHN|nr:ubiquinol-cytochrome C chaperone family protein [Novosphingobium kunmingense]PKB14555.1 cytochrome b pre-mRNA-processing protein 3 [Novosphingobium kunmingense]